MSAGAFDRMMKEISALCESRFRLDKSKAFMVQISAKDCTEDGLSEYNSGVCRWQERVLVCVNAHGFTVRAQQRFPSGNALIGKGDDQLDSWWTNWATTDREPSVTLTPAEFIKCIEIAARYAYGENFPEKSLIVA